MHFLARHRFPIIFIFTFTSFLGVANASCLPSSDSRILELARLIGRDPLEASRAAAQDLKAADLSAEARARRLAIEAEGYGRTSQADLARTTANRGLAETLAGDSSARVELLWILSTNTFSQAELAELRPRVLDLPARQHPASVETVCLNIALGSIDRMRGEFGEAARYLYHSYRGSEAVGMEDAHVEAARQLARLMGDADDNAGALDLNQTVIELEKARGNSFMLAFAHGFRGIYLNNERRFVEAIPELRTAVQNSESVQNLVGQAYLREELCRASIGLRDWTEAARQCGQSRTLFERGGNPGIFELYPLLAEIDLQAGRTADARSRLDEVIANAAAVPMAKQAQAYRLRAEASRQMGDLAAALSDLDQYIQKSRSWMEATTSRKMMLMSTQFSVDLQLSRNEALQKTLDVERQLAQSNSKNSYIMLAAVLMALLVFARMHWSEIRLRRKLVEMANTDPLTKLPNRRHMLEHMSERFEEARRTGGVFTVALLDLDRFKSINDIHGHKVGDNVLEMVAKAATALLPTGVTMARWGGEEFLVAFPGRDVEAAVAGLARLRESCASIDPNGRLSGKVNFSAGVASNDIAGETIAQLLERADGALYRAKEGGRGQTCVARSGPVAMRETPAIAAQ